MPTRRIFERCLAYQKLFRSLLLTELVQSGEGLVHSGWSGSTRSTEVSQAGVLSVVNL
jgi:hypothetical protein